jgi:hypothetical protein
MKTACFLFMLVVVFFESCTKDTVSPVVIKPAGCDSASFTYFQNVEPIIQANCSFCHYAGSGNYDYSTYEVVADRVRSGRLEERLLLPKSDPMHMPQEGALSECDLFILRTWIRQGFKEN